MTEKPFRTTRDLDFDALTNGARPSVSSPLDPFMGAFTPSPRAWEDQVFYFVLPDRFSDGKETDYLDNHGARITGPGTPRYTLQARANAIATAEEAAAWREAGKGWCGGTLAGARTKLGYLARMGITAIWLGPILKQVVGADTYHGYAIQDFLQVDPRYGSEAELVDFVKTAHQLGIYVVLDVVINHAANVFEYAPDRYSTRRPDGTTFLEPRWDGKEYDVAGFYDAKRRVVRGSLEPLPPDCSLDDAVWPAELQRSGAFHRKGRISNWDYEPEMREGDFFDMKDIDHGSGPLDDYAPSAALDTLCRCYCSWIARVDLDGFRVDTVKHIDRGAARYFSSWVHEFAQSIGKDNFILISEIAGPRADAFDTVELTGLDAALGIADVRDSLSAVAKGEAEPSEYFNLFRNSRELGKESHAWFRDKVVILVDDQDKVGRDPKRRFCASDDGSTFLLNVLAMSATTLGIPCIYYGTEQGFDGQGSGDYADRYIREAMQGEAFGAFRSRGHHFFDESAFVYVELAKILRARRSRPALRRGRQYLRDISGDGSHYGPPTGFGGPVRSLVAWSRILDSIELLCVMNTDPQSARTAWITLAAGLHPAGTLLRCFYSSDAAQVDATVSVVAHASSSTLTTAEITLPAAGFAMFE